MMVCVEGSRCGMVVYAEWWYMGNGICGMGGAEW